MSHFLPRVGVGGGATSNVRRFGFYAAPLKRSNAGKQNEIMAGDVRRRRAQTLL